MRRASIWVTVAVLVAACGADSVDPSTEDPGRVVLTVTSEGGFMPVEFELNRFPRFVVTADLSLYHEGPIPEIYPGPLLPNVQVGVVDESTWSEIMTIVDDIGFADFDERIDTEGAEMIADAPTDFITYYDESGAHRYGVYALGMTDNRSTDRLLLENLVAMLEDAAMSDTSEGYVPERLQVAAGHSMDEPEPGFVTTRDWPLERAPEEMAEWMMGWRCTVIEGDEVDDLLAVFADANQAARWTTDDGDLTIRARPLFPGEEGCAIPG